VEAILAARATWNWADAAVIFLMTRTMTTASVLSGVINYTSRGENFQRV
jgi:hypothetical protein